MDDERFVLDVADRRTSRGTTDQPHSFDNIRTSNNFRYHP